MLYLCHQMRLHGGLGWTHGPQLRLLCYPFFPGIGRQRAPFWWGYLVGGQGSNICTRRAGHPWTASGKYLGTDAQLQPVLHSYGVEAARAQTKDRIAGMTKPGHSLSKLEGWADVRALIHAGNFPDEQGHAFLSRCQPDRPCKHAVTVHGSEPTFNNGFARIPSNFPSGIAVKWSSAVGRQGIPGPLRSRKLDIKAIFSFPASDSTSSSSLFFPHRDSSTSPYNGPSRASRLGRLQGIES